MPTFELKGPDGGTYQIDAPDEHQAAAAFGQLDFGSRGGGGGEGTGKAAAASSPATPSVAADVAKAAPIGVVKGAINLAGLPGDVQEMGGSMIDRAMLGIGHKVMDWTGYGPQAGTPERDRFDKMYLDIGSGGGLPGSGDIRKGVETVTGPLYEPKTVPGQYAQTLGEFVPGAGVAGAARAGVAAGAGAFARNVAAPALAAETAGQVTKGTELEPWARAAAGVGAGVAGSLVGRPGIHERMAASAARGTSPEQFDHAAALAEEANRLGIPITASEAVQRATEGASGLGRLQRLAESTQDGARVLDPMMAARPGQVRTATEAHLDQIARRPEELSPLGLDVQSAAQRAVAATPQGRALGESIEQAGPRTTADQAGAVIQPELRQAYDRREGMRAALAEQEYDAARNAPEGIGIQRQVAAERPGDPIITNPAYSRPQFTDAAPRPLDPPPRPEAAAAATAPMSLGRFVARNGGIRLDGEAAATDLHRFNIPGLGNVARADGKSIDNFWRERLIEEGYFRPDADGGMARDISSELLRKLQNEQRGVPSFPIGQEKVAAAAKGGGSRMTDEYRAAIDMAESRLNEDLARAGVSPESLHPEVRSRVLGALVRGEHTDPLDAYERTVGAMKDNPAPYSRSTTVTEQIPDVRFGQANPQAVVEHIDRALENAKGPVAKALSQARETLFTRPGPGGTRDLDLSVTGLHNARDAIGDLIAKAEPAAQRALLGVRERLDRALTAVPEYEHARSGFEAASQNLGPFGTGSVPGRIVGQEQTTGRFTMPREQAPRALDEGVSGVRDFNAVASPAARQSYEDYLTTRLLDGATDRSGISADRLATSLRDNADVLGQTGTVQERLARVLAAREGMAPVEASPIGRMAAKMEPREQLAAILTQDATPREVAATVESLRRQSDGAARGLVREGAGRLADKTVHRLDRRGRPSQFGGAHFAKELREGREGANLQAALDAVGGAPASDRQKLIDVLAATGWREDVGARTAFNRVDLQDLEQAGFLGKAAKASSKPMASIHDAVSRAVLGRNTRQLAELLASGPAGVRRIQELQESGSSRAAIVAALLGARAAQSTPDRASSP